MNEDEQLREEAKARAELVAANTPLSTIKALYPAHSRIETYLRELCALEPWIDVIPTSDPEQWKMTAVCDDTCHHPVHAFNRKERRLHLVEVPPFD